MGFCCGWGVSDSDLSLCGGGFGVGWPIYCTCTLPVGSGSAFGGSLLALPLGWLLGNG